MASASLPINITEWMTKSKLTVMLATCKVKYEHSWLLEHRFKHLPLTMWISIEQYSSLEKETASKCKVTLDMYHI